MRGATLLAAGILLLLLGGRDFWDPDEPRFAQVAREMLTTGDWTIPHFNGRPLPLLPPLTYWTAAAVSAPVGGVSERTARLPVAAFALITLAATMLVSTRGAGWAGLVLLSSAKFLHQAQFLQSDMLLLGCQTWALAAFYRAYTSPQQRTAWLASAYVAVGLGVLAKGPLGAVLPAAVLGLFLLWERDLRSLLHMGLWWGVPLVAALVVPWFAVACARGGEPFCRELLLKHNFGMFFETWSHKRPIYYYLIQLPWMFAPWTVFLPAALYRAKLDRETRFLLIWIVFSFLFFSASDAKQAKYLLPILPPLSILVARWITEHQVRAAVRVGAGLLALLLAGASVAACFLVRARWPELLPGALLTLSAANALALAALFLAARPRIATAMVAASILVPAAIARLAVIPHFEQFKSARPLTEVARQTGWPVAIHGIAYRQTGGLIYYTGHPLPLLESPAALRSFLEAPEPRLAYVSRKAWQGEYSIVAESPYRGGTLLVTNAREPS